MSSSKDDKLVKSPTRASQWQAGIEGGIISTFYETIKDRFAQNLDHPKFLDNHPISL